MVLDKIQKENDIKNLTPAEIDVIIDRRSVLF